MSRQFREETERLLNMGGDAKLTLGISNAEDYEEFSRYFHNPKDFQRDETDKIRDINLYLHQTANSKG